MKILIAGATGAIGRHLIPLLVADGHEVVGITRDLAKVELVESLGASSVIADCLDSATTIEATARVRPDAIVHQLTDLADFTGSDLKRELASTARLRTIATDNLLKAAEIAEAQHFVAQSYIGSGMPFARAGGMVKDEQASFDPNPAPELQESLEGIRYLEDAVTGTRQIRAVVLRFGNLYGSGTAFGENGTYRRAVAGRKMPIIGGGAGVWSFTHVKDAARATAIALASDKAGIFNIVDDHPASVREWLPTYAAAIGAKPPMNIPGFVGRLIAGRAIQLMMTEARGASNAKAKSQLNWAPQYDWRDCLGTD